ncbi:hypothetical protein H0H92_010474 [Tricholoma furcatifolium]|nr:hypothetical protein H0H92_010474 [Tricholoma furcatifolium]
MKFQTTLAIISILSLSTQAVPTLHNEIYDKTKQGLRLLSLAADAEPMWKTEVEKLDLLRAGVHFFDVTEVFEVEKELPSPKGTNTTPTFPEPSHQAELTPILAKISIDNMKTYLNSLTSLNNRYYKSSTGSSTYILNTVKNITHDRPDITASQFTHSWAQASVIVKIAGQLDSSPVTIIGAHMDTINLNNPTNGRAPGADDDGTGTVNLIEGLRVLVAAGFKPSTPVEFHSYAGEEAGLLGSQAIATAYQKAGVDVKAFMELDMTGFFEPGSKEVMALESESYVDDGLNSFLKSLIGAYSRLLPWTMDTPVRSNLSFNGVT